MTFNQAAIKAVYSDALSVAKGLGPFETVIAHEPKSKPVSLPALAVWTQAITPVAAVSGLAATSGRLSLRARVYLNWLGKPEDAIDPELLRLTSLLLGAYSGGFTFGGDVMEIDLLGAYGESLSAQAGYIEHDGTMFRVMEVNLPIVIDDLWTQEA
jgi:hypothetical protein